MNKIGDFLAALFLARDIAHRAHWLASTEARHEALGDFYEDIASITDEFAEVWMGEYRRKVPAFNIESDYNGDADPVDLLRDQLHALRSMRGLVCGGSRPLENLADTIEEKFLKLLYKLEQLL